MSPQTSFLDLPPARHSRGISPSAWDAPAVFAAPERKKKRSDRTSICVQITLCIVVTALLVSVMAAPRRRASSVKPGAERAALEAADGR